jgi:hypothetical protein
MSVGLPHLHGWVRKTGIRKKKKTATKLMTINEDINPNCVGFIPENKRIGNLVLMALCCNSE